MKCQREQPFIYRFAFLDTKSNDDIESDNLTVGKFEGSKC